MDHIDNFKKILITKYNDIKANPSTIAIPIIIIILFNIISYFLYKNFIKQFLEKKFVLNKEFVDQEKDNGATIIYFYTEWCPYCKKSKPEWNQFKDLIDLQSFKEKISITEIDCDKNPEIADTYKIEGYPSIKLIYQGEVYDFDAKPESKIILQFVESILPQK